MVSLPLNRLELVLQKLLALKAIKTNKRIN